MNPKPGSPGSVHPVALVLIVHDHQPVGNFDGVIDRACDDAYAPFLAFLERHPRVRLALHISGPLLEWMSAHRRELITQLRALVSRGQVEPWGGGFYEPILPAIPERDRVAQIRALSDWIEDELGKRPTGLWLTERVWEPQLAATLVEAGMTMTAVDDAHFVGAGLERDELWGTFLTEDQGNALRVFPIHRELRYAIPFEPPDATLELLRRVAAGGPGRIAVLGDDGEKFGVWPGTKKRVWEEGWLDRFAEMLEANPWIELRTPSEAIAHHPPLGLAYLPEASYHEMQEWALKPEAQKRHQRAAAALEPIFGPAAADLVRGGQWRSFLTRYPESNRLHKRMLRASRRIDALALRDADWREARRHLWRSQCNCPYWHGVFGGLYLPMLRSALYHELIAAERFTAPPAPHVERGDLDLDGAEDALLETPEWAAWISTRGGAMWAFDDRRAGWNYGDTLARRPEAYHEALRGAMVGGGEGVTIHGAIRVTEPGLEKLIEKYDEGTRDSFLERWIEGEKEFSWRTHSFAFQPGAPDAVSLACAEGEAPALTKHFRARAGVLEVELMLAATRTRRGRLEVTLNLGLHVPEAPDRWIEIDGAKATPPHFAAAACHEAVRRAAFVDAWAGRRLEIVVDRAAQLRRAPIETVSLSERGAEKVFQGLETCWTFDADLTANEPWRVVFTLEPRLEGRKP